MGGDMTMLQDRYLGAKTNSGLYQMIIALMPPHDRYFELFFGTGQIFKKKQRAMISYINDLNSGVLSVSDYVGQIDVVASIGDALSMLDAFDFNGSDLIYLDPPYLWGTRNKNLSNKYKFELSDESHIRLLDLISGIDANIIISGYNSDLYNDRLGNWNKKELQVMTRGGVRTECVWFNFEPNKAFWCDYAGSNFTERQRIKRKAARWASDFKSMPHGEQLAILNAMFY